MLISKFLYCYKVSEMKWNTCARFPNLTLADGCDASNTNYIPGQQNYNVRFPLPSPEFDKITMYFIRHRQKCLSKLCAISHNIWAWKKSLPAFFIQIPGCRNIFLFYCNKLMTLSELLLCLPAYYKAIIMGFMAWKWWGILSSIRNQPEGHRIRSWQWHSSTSYYRNISLSGR